LFGTATISLPVTKVKASVHCAVKVAAEAELYPLLYQKGEELNLLPSQVEEGLEDQRFAERLRIVKPTSGISLHA